MTSSRVAEGSSRVVSCCVGSIKADQSLEIFPSWSHSELVKLQKRFVARRLFKVALT